VLLSCFCHSSPEIIQRFPVRPADNSWYSVQRKANGILQMATRISAVRGDPKNLEGDPESVMTKQKRRNMWGIMSTISCVTTTAGMASGANVDGLRSPALLSPRETDEDRK
jgi:hypothetical protein